MRVHTWAHRAILHLKPVPGGRTDQEAPQLHAVAGDQLLGLPAQVEVHAEAMRKLNIGRGVRGLDEAHGLIHPPAWLLLNATWIDIHLQMRTVALQAV